MFRATGLPETFALVETTGMSTASHIAAAVGLVVIRTARPGLSPVTILGTRAAGRTIQVTGCRGSGSGSEPVTA